MALFKRRKPLQFSYDEDLTFLNGMRFKPLLDVILPKFDGEQLPTDLDPMDFPEWVPDLIMAELTGEGPSLGLAMRYFGGEPVQYYGELQGESFSKEGATADQDRWIAHAEKVKSLKRPLRLYTQQVQVKSQLIDIESLLVPTAEDGLSIDRIFCFGHYIARHQ